MNKNLARLILFAASVLGLLVPMSARAQSWSNGYAFRRPITIDHTKVPNTDQTNFPVLISGTYSYLATTANGGDVTNANGYDIIFASDAAGTNALPFERESYSASTGAVCFWVKVPTASHTADTVIYMFYGNGSVFADPSTKAAVWDANYVGVWHLPNGTTLGAKDSTSQANNGTITGATANGGKVAGGASLSGSTQYIDVGNSSSLQITGSALSIEVWLNTSESNPGQWKRVVTKEVANNANPYVAYSLNRVANTNQLTFGVSHGGAGTGASVTSVSSLPMGTWTHVVGTYDGSYLRLYINGSQDAQAATSGSIVNTNQDVVIGADTAAATEYFNGMLDEVRISTSGRSADWIATEYRNESSPSTFYSVGSATINGLNGSSAPYIAGLSPSSGAPTSTVTVLGANFGATQGTSTVAFNGTATTTASSWSDTSIVVSVPTGAATGSVIVHVNGVDSNGAGFTVTGPPSISGLSLTTGAPGASVTITGTNFGGPQASGTVTFNGTSATVTAWSATSIVAVVPATATSGNVVVAAAGVSSNGVSFTVVPPPTITGISPTSASIGAPVTISGSNFGSSQGVVKLNGITCSVLIWGPSSITVSVPTGASSGAFAVTASGVTVNSPTFTVSTALPQGWSDQEIGPNTPGSAAYANNVFTMQSKGGDYSGSSTADNFHFAYQTLTGDGTIIARIVSISNGYGEAGVMMRETLDPGAKRVATAICTGDENFLYRATIGAASSYVGAPYPPGANAPYWSKLTRSGNTFTGYISADGVNWVRLGTSQSINMAQTIFIGLAVAGGSAGSPYTYTFDNVSVSPASNPAPLITSVSATTAPVGAQVVITGQNFGATQGSSTVLLHGTATTINSWSATSISITIPTGATSGYLVVSVAPSMNDSNPIDFTVETNALPQTWLDQDVGVVHFAGNASYSSGVFSVYAGGNTADAVDGYHFVYQTLTGDGTIIARVVNTGYSYAMAGVMMTASLNANDQNVFLCEYAGGTRTFYRSLFGTSNQVVSSGGGLPYWVKLVRIGSNFIAYISPDNTSWTLVAGPIPVAMPNTIYVGIASTSNNGGQAYTATFDNVSIATATNPAPVITSVSATTASAGTQVIITGSGFGSTQGVGIATLNQASIPVGFWSDTSVMVTIPSGATSGYLNVLRGPDMQSSNGVYFTVESQPLISGWLDLDIGNPATKGSASYSGGVFTIQGSGGSGGATSDSLHFVYQPLSTDGTIIARVASATSNARAGVMIRQSLSATSTEAFMYAFPYGNPAFIGEFDYRTLTGGPTSSASVGSGSLGWVKLIRNTNTYSAYYASDGNTWTQVGTTQTIPSSQTVYVGLAVTGIIYGNTATFDNVSITAGSSLPNPVISSIAPLSGAPGTLVTISGSGFGTTQSNSTVMFNGAPSTSIYSWSNTQIQAVVPDQATTGPISIVVNNITGQGPTFTVAFSVTLTDSLGNATAYTSSPFGGQWSFTDAQGSGCSSCTTRGTVHRQYDGQGNVAWSIDALGHGTVYRYDSSNNTTSQTVQGDATTSTATTTYTYNSLGEPLTVTDPLGNVTTNAYDGHGNLTSVTQPRPNGGTNASVTQFGYNTLGQLVTITDPLSHVTTITYTPAGLIYTITDMQSHVTAYGYDAHGNRTSVLDAANQLTTFAYDAMDRLTTITYPDRTSTTTFGYDSRGRRTSVTDQNGKTTTYAYDDADRLTSVTDASTPPNVTAYGYDTENNLTSITDANQNQTVFEYDQFGRVKKTNFPSSNIETYGYDANNNLISKTDRKGQTIQYVYDVLNRLTRKQYQDSTEVDYVYDLVGKIQQVTDPTGTYAFAYDNMGRLIGTTTNYNFLPSKTFSTSYSYDAASNRTGFTDPEQGSTTYAYDTLNRLQTLTPPVAISSGSFGFGYDALSRRTSLTRPNNITTAYSYNNLSYLQSVLHQLSGSTIDGATYVTDSTGNRTSKTDQRTAVTTTYGYDNIYQLLSATPSSGTAENYTYDPAGNRLSSAGVASYSYNSSNELTSSSAATYGYDLNGNAITKNDSTGITTYAWDFENRLTSVTLPGSVGTVTFKYDPFGRRIYKTSANVTSVFAYDRQNLIEEANATGTPVARYLQTQNIDEPLAMFRSSTTSYYHTDGLGSVTSLSDGAGTLARTYGYDAFGNQTSSSGSLSNSFQFTARESDAETRLYYYRARYYDTSTGRFLNEDPIRFVEGENFYKYARNQPTYFRDPSGRASIGGGFSPQCLADLLNALNIIRDRIKTLPSCNCWFLSNGSHVPLKGFLDNPMFGIKFDPTGNSDPGEGDTLAYVDPGDPKKHKPSDPLNIFITPLGCASGPTHLAQDIVHEFGHLSMGHASGYYGPHRPLPDKDHNDVRLAETACGFAIQGAGQSITVTP